MRLLKMMDTTIEFVTMHKKVKFYFFSDLKKNIYENGRTELTHKHLQQLLFIDDQLFRVEWQVNQKLKCHDLLIFLPQIPSEDQRL